MTAIELNNMKDKNKELPHMMGAMLSRIWTSLPYL